MKRLLLISLFLLSFVSFAEDSSSIVVFGEAENAVLSDEWQLSVEFSLKEKTRDSIITEYNKVKEEAYKKLKALGIKEDEIKTESFSLSPWYEWQNNSNVKKGYQLSHFVSIKKDKFQLMNKIVVALTPLQGTNIGGLSHMLKPKTREAEMNKLYAKAYDSAKVKVDALLSASGKKLKRIALISEDLSASNPPTPQYDRVANMMNKSAMASGSGPNIELSLIPLDINLNMRLKVVATFE